LQENPEQGRDFLKKIGSNFRLSGQKLFLDFKFPFKITAEAEPERSEGEATIAQNPNFENGGTFWTKSELFLTKIPILTFRPAPAFPPAEFRRAKQNNFLSIFCILRAPFFLLKDLKIVLL